MTFGFDFEWSLEWFGISITYLPTYLPIRDWDLIYVAPGATAEILRRPVIPPNADLDSSLEVSTLL